MIHAEAAINLALYCAFAIPAAIVDFRTRRLPDALTLSGALALLVSTTAFTLWPPAGTPLTALIAPLAAAFLCSGLFLILHSFTKGLGLGDVKFVASTGLLCGLAGSALALLVASASALTAWAILAALGKADRSTRVPFGPFIAFGTVASAFAAIFFFR
jgi:leader peptidase (prepilin peptidase) / N-methyltransferase